MLGLTACGGNNWADEEALGEISIDPSDTESLTVTEEFVSEENNEQIDLTNIVNKNETENYSLVVHECNYFSADKNIVLKGMIHILGENVNTVNVEVFDSKGEIIGTGDVELKNDSNKDVNFSIDVNFTNKAYTIDDVENITVLAK